MNQEERDIYNELVTGAKELSLQQFKDGVAQLGSSDRAYIIAAKTSFPEEAEIHVDNVMGSLSAPR